jgi:RNA polymerase sigma-70 factor, ECF subfamily
MLNEGGRPIEAFSDKSSTTISELMVQAPGDSEDLARILEEYRPYLLAIAQAEFPSDLAPKVGPSDLVQLTLTKGHFRFEEFRGQSREELAGWLRQILLNQLKTEVRTYHREKRDIAREVQIDSGIVDLEQLSASGEALSREERALLDAALARLTPVHRQAIQMRHGDDLSFRELGVRLSRSEEAARKLWTRAVQRLQEELGVDATGRAGSS